MDTTKARHLTPAEAAAELRVSTDTVLRLIASGDLAALRVSPRVVRIPAPAFAVFLSGRTPTRRTVVRRRRPTDVTFGQGERLAEPQHA